MKKNYYAKALALTVAASMVSVPAFAAEGTDDPQAQEKTVEQDEQKGEKSAEEEQEKTEQFVKEKKIEDGISAASDDDQETAVAEGEVFAKGVCGATEEDEVSWELVKNDDALYCKAEENGYSYATTDEDGYEKVDGYTLTISGEGNIADYYGKNITIDSFEGDIAPWRRALLSDVEADRTTQEVVPITKVIVEDGITGIGTDAFSYLALNGTITFNENVTYYGSGVYSYCPLITTVDFTNFKPKNVSDYWIPGHEMLTGSAVPYGFFDKDKSLNTCIVDGKTYTGELALPERIDTICTAAFRGTGFDTINFDNGLKDIKEVGPYGMSNLANIDTFTGWNTAKNGTGTAYAVGDIIPTTADITVYAQWKLNAPTVSVTGNATKQYDGGNVTLTAATSVSGVTYQWQRDGVNIDGATNATYTVKNVADSGSYTVKITDTEGKTAVSNATAISITKKEVAVPTVESKIYNGTVLTADVTATADYDVTKNEGGKNAGVYDVILTLKDADNYKWADSEEAAKTIPFTVAPKKVELTVDNSTLKGAGSVTFTVDGVCNGDTAKVVCDVDSIKVEGLKASLPNATMEYTFTTDMGGNYEPASCVVSVTRRKSGSSSSDTSAPTYGVSTGKTENGEISVTPAKAEAGETVTIKATPDSGYQLDKMTVKDKNNSTVKLKKVDDNEYTFTMPVGKVSVDATFVQKDAADDSNAAEAGKTIKLQIGSRIVNVDNEAVIYDAAPVIRNDRTLVPIRIITEALGGKVDWNGATKEVTLSINDKEIKMTIGKTLEKYGVAPVIIDGRTFVPVRFVADELGANVAWDDATKTVTIKTAR